MYNTKFKGDVCSHSHSYFLDNSFRKFFQNPRRLLGEYIDPGDLVVDLGCGPGFFSIEMARMAGETGRVIAVDLQTEMLEKVKAKAIRKGLLDRMRLHACTQDRIGLEDTVKADFVLAYYMVHETLDHLDFLKQVKQILKTSGRFLLVEPVFHVSKYHFQQIVDAAVSAGFSLVDLPGKKGGRSALLTV
ncbi:MAG: methyltransferase domain-containing protein [Pseudomonadota bacterium]